VPISNLVQDQAELIKNMVANFDPKASSIEQMFGLDKIKAEIDKVFSKWINSDQYYFPAI